MPKTKRNNIPLSEQTQIRMSRRQMYYAVMAAEEVGVPLSEWIRSAIGEKIKRDLPADRLKG